MEFDQRIITRRAKSPGLNSWLKWNLPTNRPADHETVIAGQRCLVYVWPQGERAYWGSVLLRQKTDTFVKEAVDLQLDVPIPEELFKFPEGFRMVDEDAGAALPAP